MKISQWVRKQSQSKKANSFPPPIEQARAIQSEYDKKCHAEYTARTKMGAFNQFKEDGNMAAYLKRLRSLDPQPTEAQPVEDSRFKLTSPAATTNVNPNVRAFYGSQEYLVPTSNDCTFVNECDIELQNKAKATPQHFVKHGYYLMHDKGICYYQPVNPIPNAAANSKQLPTMLIHGAGSEQSVRNSLRRGEEPKHITEAEFKQLVQANVPKSDLFKCYSQLRNREVEMNTEIAQPVF